MRGTAPIKVGFVLPSSVTNPIPSTRIAALNMRPYLSAAGFDPHVVFEPVMNTETPDVTGLGRRLKAEGFGIVLFQKVHGQSVVALARELQAASIKTVFSVCDVVAAEMADLTDATVAVTEYLKSQYPTALQAKIHVVHDGVERPELHKTDWGSHSGSRTRPIRAVLVTSVALDRVPVLADLPSWLHVTIVGRYPPAGHRLQRLREAYWQMARKAGRREQFEFLRFLVHPRIARAAWDAAGVYAAMQQADIGIIPIETAAALGAMEGWQVKSENRLTLKMAMGLPVVATPIPSYVPVVRQGVDALLARTHAEWLSCLSQLRDPEFRREMGQQARQTALHKYSMERQAEKLVAVLRSLCSVKC